MAATRPRAPHLRPLPALAERRTLDPFLGACRAAREADSLVPAFELGSEEDFLTADVAA
ncbi:hypothetical protein [Miltoncostaea marina]|uniref:hypothetical protein n=1 Tax=Miltoncostaea marina TaxID=2843215 RepID=UPI001C3CA710|nr:hypothetical protein [Miltoncostaea marina]